MTIHNESFDSFSFNDTDIFIFSLGYEKRSYYIYNKIQKKINSKNVLALIFDDYKNYPHTAEQKDTIIKNNSAQVEIVSYNDSEKVSDIITDFISDRDERRIHFDYSSMPRSWYCRIPNLLKKSLDNGKQLFFWYSEGKYPQSYDEFPSAGIHSFSLFSGIPDLSPTGRRSHILALGYDSIRTQAITSIIDPDILITCYTYSMKRPEIKGKILKINKELLAKSTFDVAFRLEDFSFMVSKLCEIVYERIDTGSVIFVPDGPKPLIFAMSLVPNIIDKPGVTCMHMSRNNEHFTPLKVEPRGTVFGFSIKQDPNNNSFSV